MALTPLDLAKQQDLKKLLQAEKGGKPLENLAAALVGGLLGIPIAVAKSGFQFGADAGTAGRQGRRLRLECKKYSDDTALSDRELLGEMDQAVERDEALEAWVLAATRNVSEQLADHLTLHSERIGVPVLIIDWKDQEPAPLAALCASDPDTVERLTSKKAANLARALQPAMGDAIVALRRSLEEWSLGFETLRSKSHDKIRSIWTSERTSKAELGQDAAGGAQPKKVRRQSVHNELDAWWRGPAMTDAPVAIIGWDGVGKTWAAVDWLVERVTDQPIVLIVPSSASASTTEASESSVVRFLAKRLLDLTGIRDVDHWSRRLRHLLKRPLNEGPLLTVLFDGINQEPSVPWQQLLKSLQSPAFEGKIRVMLSTRRHHFDDKLAQLRGLAVPAKQLVVDLYDVADGGELDQMLDFEGLKRADLHPDLIALARTPRLFKLVIHFRSRLIEAGQVTVHRLLWEYGRDSFGDRAGKSFSEEEWRAWLAEIANGYRKGIQEYSLKNLGETASRPDLTHHEVSARLSDIIDGRFVHRGPAGAMQLDPVVVSHALGAALLAHLDTMRDPTFAEADVEISKWLDPIAGLDQRAEILRAAVSIFIERGGPTATPLGGVLVTAWLQTQNVTDAHRMELANLAPSIPDALLDAVEQSNPQAQASARLWAINALRAIPRTEGSALSAIVKRVCSWLSVVSREVESRANANADIEKQRSERYCRRIGTDKSGQLTVLGVTVLLVEHDDGRLQAAIPSILEGFPLAKITPCFEMLVVTSAVRGHSPAWQGFKWLCYLNEVDPEATADSLRALSAEVEARPAEAGIHPGLPARAAALLLWLCGYEADEDGAVAIEPDIDDRWSYEKDYLGNPSTSMFTLERRHAAMALEDKSRPIYARIRRVDDLWLDPTFSPPASFITELREAAAGFFAVEKLHSEMGRNREDWAFEELAPALARCAPDILADLMRRWMQGFASRPAESRYWSAIHASDTFILADEAASSAAQALRLSARENDEDREAFARCDLIRLELKSLIDPQSQFDRLIAADLSFIPADLVEVILAPSAKDVDALIARHSTGTIKQRNDLVLLLSVHPIRFSDEAWSWLLGLIDQLENELLGVLFRMLTLTDPERFGQVLMGKGWGWSPSAPLWVNHFGSGALIETGSALPFDQLAPRIAPWRILEAARVRGGDPADVRLAAEIFGRVLAAGSIPEPDPGSTITVDRTEKQFALPMVSVHPRSNPDNKTTPSAEFAATVDHEARTKAFKRAVETAASRIEEVRRSGASLYLTDVEAIDVKLVAQHASDQLDTWLDGVRDLTNDFRRRVLLAEPAYLAICEALLDHDPARGVVLWRALRTTMTTHYRGDAGIDELLHIIFRASDSADLDTLRNDVIGLVLCPTDLDLFNVAAAAAYNGKTAWIAHIVAEDRASPLIWRQRRSIVLSGFSISNVLPVPDAWPEGPLRTDIANLRHKAARNRWREACAHHWWLAYLNAPDALTAYAAWTLFLRTADNRISAWMNEAVEEKNDGDKLFAVKIAHMRLNRSGLISSTEDQIKENKDKLFSHDTLEGVGPWGRIN